MDEIRSYLENIDIVDADYCENFSDCFASIPDIAQPLVRDAKKALSKIEQLLYSGHAFIDVIKNDLPHIHPHAFRHTAASTMIASGVDLVTTAAELGHANANTTATIYAHQIAIARATAADVRAGVFAGRK